MGQRRVSPFKPVKDSIAIRETMRRPAEMARWRRVAGLSLSFLLIAIAGFVRAGAAPLRVCVLSGSGVPSAGTRDAVAGLVDFLVKSGSIACDRRIVTDAAAPESPWRALGESDVAVLWVRGCRAGDQGKEAMSKFIEKGGGVVVLGESGGAWTDWPEFESAVLGARFGAKFEGGLPMRVINLYPHSIFAGVDRLETPEAMHQCELAADAQVIMEGTVGEATVPMGWVRQGPAGRVLCLQPGSPFLLGDAQFLRIVSNGARWAARHPVPQARALVQRTQMRGAYPGALAICLPGGPSLCFDTVRGGINYMWDGDFVDLRPWWTARHGDPINAFAARFAGNTLYEDKSLSQAMHVGPRNGQSEFHFRGYRIGNDGFPELLCSVGGREVAEEIHPVGDGVAVECSFRVAPGPSPLWVRLEDGSGAEVGVSGAVREGSFVRFDAPGAGHFAVILRGKPVSAP